MFVSFIFSALIGKQISRFSDAAAEIGSGNLTHPLTLKADDEFSPLIHAFKQMVGDLERSRNELQSEKNKLESINEAMQDGFTVQNRDFNIIYQNKLLQTIFGGMGEKCHRVYENNEEICEGCPVLLAFKDGKSHSAVRRVILPNGQPSIWENVACPIRDASGEIVSCLEIARDVTDKYQIEEQLRKAQKWKRLVSWQGASLTTLTIS